MTRADMISVETDEGRFVLIIDTDEGELTVDVHDVALELHHYVNHIIGPYAAEAESARKAVAAGVRLSDSWSTPQPVRSRPVSVEDAIEAGYALDDPKSPGFHDRMSEVWDSREGK